MSPSPIELAATLCFGLAVIHTFFTSYFKKQALRFSEGSIGENAFHLLGEVEVVFGFWAGVLLTYVLVKEGPGRSVFYLESRNFAEPIFVFAILACSATKPILNVSKMALALIAKVLPLSTSEAFYLVALSLGPLLGSFITEPAAMALTALLLKDFYFDRNVSTRFKYITLAVLFVNVSVGGVLTPYAAPPVLMVAERWGFDLHLMLVTFGWKAILICVLNACGAFFYLRHELKQIIVSNAAQTLKTRTPFWVIFIHLFFLLIIVISHRHPVMVIGLFLFFLGMVTITNEYQDELKLRESLLVSFFLAGLVVLGGFQSWWLRPLIQDLHSFTLFIGATFLTAITDNAALTYLGAQLPSVSEEFKYALLTGAVTGGGLTVIANAPNPAGFSILQKSFGPEGIRPEKLFIAALIPTLIAGAVFWILK